MQIKKLSHYNILKKSLLRRSLSKHLIKRVAMAKDFFPVLKTLVVPIFPEPIFLISCFKKIFVINKPNGIDPRI